MRKFMRKWLQSRINDYKIRLIRIIIYIDLPTRVSPSFLSIVSTNRLKNPRIKHWRKIYRFCLKVQHLTSQRSLMMKSCIETL